MLQCRALVARNTLRLRQERLRFYGEAEVVVMSRDPTARCRYCGYVYYLEKLAAHEDVCSSRPKTTRRARLPPRVIIARENIAR